MKRLVITTRSTRIVLLAATLVSNVLALTMPLVARQILSVGGQGPQRSTIIVLVLMVLAAAMLEAAIKCCRTMLLGEMDRRFLTRRIHWLLDRVARAKTLKFRSAAAASLDYSGALQQVKGLANGELTLIWAELSFIPLILAVLFMLSPACALAVFLFMVLLMAHTYRITRRFSTIAEDSRETTEHRFERLFTVLDRMHLVKALAVEQHMSRVYEQAHGAAMRNNLLLAMSATRLTHSAATAGMLLNLVLLMTCAVSAIYGRMDVSLVISIVLLSSRLMDPVQRAVFIFVQGRDRQSAFDKIVDLDERTTLDRSTLPEGTFKGFERMEVAGLSLFNLATRPVSLTIAKGDFIAISSPFPNLSKGLMRAMAGLEPIRQDGGENGHVRVNGTLLGEYALRDRNRILGYVAANSPLFDGTIQDNITRFGAVSVEQAFEVAALFGIDERLDELPGGLLTKVGDGASGNVPPGLERQIAILRAVVHKPAVILFDHAEQGLDRDSYAGLVRFFSQVRHQATVILASEDTNLTSLADRCYHLDQEGLSMSRDLAAADVPYRAMVL